MIELYNSAMQFAENEDLTKTNSFQQVCNLFDMDSLIDYFAIGAYIHNCAGDWPQLNTAL